MGEAWPSTSTSNALYGMMLLRTYALIRDIPVMCTQPTLRSYFHAHVSHAPQLPFDKLMSTRLEYGLRHIVGSRTPGHKERQQIKHQFKEEERVRGDSSAFKLRSCKVLATYACALCFVNLNACWNRINKESGIDQNPGRLVISAAVESVGAFHTAPPKNRSSL